MTNKDGHLSHMKLFSTPFRDQSCLFRSYPSAWIAKTWNRRLNGDRLAAGNDLFTMEVTR